MMSDTLKRLVEIANEWPVASLWSLFAEAISAPEMPNIFDCKTEKNFDHVVLVSGGSDSTIAAHYVGLHCQRTGETAVGLYCDFGQPYADHEIGVARSLLPDNIPIMRQSIPINYDARLPEWKHIMPARNLLAFDAGAKLGGEGCTLWFGVVNGESPKRGGDKSKTFLELAEKIFSQCYGLKEIKTMLHYTKAEWAFWWLYNGFPPDTLLKTITCYRPSVTGNHCGTCQACLRKWASLTLAGYKESELAPYFDLDPLKYAVNARQKYETMMLQELRTGVGSYGKRRCRQVLTVIAPDKLKPFERWSWENDFKACPTPFERRCTYSGECCHVG